MPRMSTILNDPAAREASIRRICEETVTPDRALDLNHGVRTPEDLHRILLQEPVRIDREALAIAAIQAFSPDANNE